jgi:general secretion pathway protein K
VRKVELKSTERGFALLLVLVGLAVVALVVAAVVDGARRYAREADAEVALVRMRAATDGAIATVERDLAESGNREVPVLRDPSQVVQVGSILVTISVRPEASKIDLNAADISQIKALLLASGFAADRAERLADQIADWRDIDSEARPMGAETADYLAAGLAYGPANRPFESVSEFALLLDGSADLAACLAPDVTVFTRRGDIDMARASERVRHALAPNGPQSAATPVSIITGRAVPAGGIYELDAVAKGGIAEGSRFSRRSIVRVTGDARKPIWLLSSQSPIPSAADTEQACERAAHPSRSSS